ncbi:MAG: hypothetical protein A2015_17035 [Spirochaetes bacterium GWF1_31_7]|nr:MAG: hypothetical protein A2Y30_14400 [Spirochaetes bacterium GWE1_32_154]OHD50147.1 MAG: hypothetical protein A2Y29_12445 [Spirochaetes bacterium GWE2_31_10]OHD52461.1 MAG: hypothetical protein A2015_17035 [Spirochaetes bacterium GWF1_31_7]OHD81955.1 MAG: hypothetical protein A2355_17660 [Spirochaetes bacterium RIFOXYB1_FULL_32_8]HBD96108.1 hypothetical protein [Spirochaetia bacterium]
MNLIFSNSGLVADNDLHLTSRPISIHIGFIISATAAMIDDNPIKEKIENELGKLKFSDSNKLLTIGELILKKTIMANKDRIVEYSKLAGKSDFCGYSIVDSRFVLTKYVKTGVILEKTTPTIVKLLSIKNPHPVLYSRDFIGFFFEASITGVINLMYTDKSKVKAKIAFTKIPILAFKSENSINNTTSLNISKSVMKRITGKDLDLIV